MEQIIPTIKYRWRRFKIFCEQLPRPFRRKYHPKKSAPRNHAPVSSLYLLDYDRRIAELGLEHEPLAFQILGQQLIFKKGRWGPASCQGNIRSSPPEHLRNVREKYKVLQDQNNMLQLKLDLAMDMLTETTANLMMLDDTELNEGEQADEEKKEEEAPKVEIKDDEEELVEVEKIKAISKKIPKQSFQYLLDLDRYDPEEDELLTPAQRKLKYLLPLISDDDNDLPAEPGPMVVNRKRPDSTKPKVCQMRRAGQARARMRASLYNLSPPPKAKASPQVCKLDMEPVPRPRKTKKRRKKPKPKMVDLGGTCKMK